MEICLCFPRSPPLNTLRRIVDHRLVHPLWRCCFWALHRHASGAPKTKAFSYKYSNEPSNVGEPQLDVPHMSSHYIIDILSAFTIAFRQPMIDSRTYPIIAASIFLLGASNVLALDLTPSIQDANFATAGSYTAVLGALGSTSSGPIGTAGDRSRQPYGDREHRYWDWLFVGEFDNHCDAKRPFSGLRGRSH